MNFLIVPMGINPGLHCLAEPSLSTARDGASSCRTNLRQKVYKGKWHGHHTGSGSAPVQLTSTDTATVAVAADTAASHWKFTGILQLSHMLNSVVFCW